MSEDIRYALMKGKENEDNYEVIEFDELPKYIYNRFMDVWKKIKERRYREGIEKLVKISDDVEKEGVDLIG